MSGDEELTILTVSGKPGSGTSTLVERIAEERGWNSVNGGDVFRSEASRRGISVEEFSRLCKEDLDVDRSLDTMLKDLLLSEKAPEIIESRLIGWWAHSLDIECLKVWIRVSDEERARRIVEREGLDYGTALSVSRQRNEDDMQRYRVLYGIDLDDMAPYNLIVDADSLNADEVFSLVNSRIGE
jgi:predicted cytidylate kinase